MARCSEGTTWWRYADRTGLVTPDERHHDEERDERYPEGARDSDDDGRTGRGRRGRKKQRRPSAAVVGRESHDLIAGHHRERDSGGDQPRDPDRVALEELEQVRLSGVEPPREEAHLHR